MRNLVILLITASLLITSCQSTQPLFEYKSIEANQSMLKEFYIPSEPILTEGDKITLSIWGHEELSIGSVNSVYTSNEKSGKWLVLDPEGKVNLPRIGRIKLGGLTVKEAGYYLEQQYGRILTNPIINVRVLNHFVTVLGEVNKPGRYNLENDAVSLIELLGMAEGLSNYSQNEKLEVIRIINDQPVKLTIDLTDLASLPQKNITLQRDDVVYIGPTKRKDKDRNLEKATLVASIATGIAVIISVFAR